MPTWCCTWIGRIGLTSDGAFSDSGRKKSNINRIYNICAFHSIPIKSDPISEIPLINPIRVQH